ncbi:hypothetical protein Sango_0127400 [Sesamum angolense]|uniref:Uncharacterized protein n=1 Tax=Sesamum angolense TaxID=2727404 RepID=A0AAE1XF17_9LAMI|nr:hypothetical protein Sango_0127400 [Sesamum angolense]
MPTMNKMLERALNTRRSPHAGEEGASGEDEGGDETADESKTLIHSRDLICISAFPSHHVSRLFSGSDGLESDFGSLGVPWKKLNLAAICASSLLVSVLALVSDLWPMGELLELLCVKRQIETWKNCGMDKGGFAQRSRGVCADIRNPTHREQHVWHGFDHSFGLWFITRWVKPELMIESGAFKGHSTWVLRQAMPDTHILSLSPRHPEKYLKKGPAYVDGNCSYFAGKDFVDFGSMDWEKVMKEHGIKDHSRVLVFFDDHQNELKRLKQALKAGFKHLVFEDNYDTGTGDHYSFRQICDQFYIRGGGHSCFKDSDEARIRSRRKKLWEKAIDIDELCGPGEAWWGVRGHMRDDFNHSNKAITFNEHFQNSRFVESVLDVYWELPPVAGPSLTHQTRYDPARAPNPIVEDGRYGLFQRVGLSRLETSVFNGYTQMVYLQVSEPET